MTFKETRYGVIINTNEYAGNFERELTAYCTGQVGECDVGEDEAALFVKELGVEYGTESDPFWDAIDIRPDEHGCYRPCEAFSDNDHYKSVLIYFAEPPTKKQVMLIGYRAHAYKDKRSGVNPKVLGVRAIKIQVIQTEYDPIDS